MPSPRGAERVSAGLKVPRFCHVSPDVAFLTVALRMQHTDAKSEGPYVE